MSLQSLPIEILLIILKKLDIKSVFALYDVCQMTREMVCMHNVLKKISLSMSPLASVKYLNTSFFKDIANHLIELNLSGIKDINKTAMICALKRLKTLQTLDVSYTPIDLLDFVEFYDICPTITNISINCVLIKSSLRQKPEEALEKIKNTFRNMKNVHFVGSCINLMYSDLPLLVVSNSDLNIFKMTILDLKSVPNLVYDENFLGSVKFREFYVYLMYNNSNCGHIQTMTMFQGIKKGIYEIIVIVNKDLSNKVEVFATPVFYDFFIKNFSINVNNISLYNNLLEDNTVIMLFEKKSVNINEVFFTRLHHKIKDYFSFDIDSNIEMRNVALYNWFYSSPVVHETKRLECTKFKRQRVAQPYHILDYDNVLKNKHLFSLSIHFNDNFMNHIALSSSTKYLSSITSLNLSGYVRYSVEFFNILFRCCNNLNTLNVNAPNISTCVCYISRSIPLSKTLKNLHLVDRRFDFNNFFSGLSQCKTLENIHLIDLCTEYTVLSDPSTLFENCKNLYNISLTASMSDSYVKKMRRVFNKAKIARDRPQIVINLFQNKVFNEIAKYDVKYDISLQVFDVFPIKPEPSYY